MSRLVNYSTVLQQSCELTGRVYPPTIEESAMFRTYIGLALRQAWEFYDWPEMREYSREYFAPYYDPTVTYSVGSIVYYYLDTKYYQKISSIAAGTTPTVGVNWVLAADKWPTALIYSAATSYSVANIVFYEANKNYYYVTATPTAGTLPTDTTKFAKLIVFQRTINLTTDSGGTLRTNEIGDVLSITENDPRLFITETSVVNYNYSSAGIVIDNDISAVWLKRTLSPPLSTDLGVSVVTVPYRFSDFCSYFAGGRMLTVDGKGEMGAELITTASGILAKEILKVSKTKKV